MSPAEQIKDLEDMGITRYKISVETGICQGTLYNWLRGGRKPMKSNSNVAILNEYYEKIKQSKG